MWYNAQELRKEIIMKKTALFLTIILIITTIAFPLSAYEIEGYEMHHEAGMVIYLDDERGDTVVYEKNADKRMYPASITKLMTALVMVENIPDLDNTYISFSQNAAAMLEGTGSVVLGLGIGESISARDALAALLIKSSGDVAYAIAEHIGGTKEGFAEIMNQKAAELGLKDTHFINPVGLHDDEHYSTARELYIIARNALDVPVIKEMCSASRYIVDATDRSSERVIYTTNRLIDPSSDEYYDKVTAGKTGFTEPAGRCLLTVGESDGYEYMTIVLNTTPLYENRNEFRDTANMYRWAFDSFEYKTVVKPYTEVTELPIALAGDIENISVCFDSQGLEMLLPADTDLSAVEYELHLTNESYTAPVEKGTAAGTADIYYGGEKLGTLDLIISESVASDTLQVIMSKIKAFFTSPFMIAVYCIIGILIIGFITLVAVLRAQAKKRRRRRKLNGQRPNR